jgi:hypothetical protein
VRGSFGNRLRHLIALPITIGSVRYPGIKIHETRIIRLMEVLLHGGTRHARRRLDGQGDQSGHPHHLRGISTSALRAATAAARMEWV